MEPNTSGWADVAGFAPIPKVDLAGAAVGQIRDAILSGDIAAGDELPSERELALQLGINRTTVRDVLTHLELLGIIDRRHGKRCRVLDYRRHGSLELIPHLVRLGTPGVGRSIREATAITYEGTAALAAQRRSGPGLVELEGALVRLEEAVTHGGDDDIIAADREFHHTVAALTDSLALELSVTDFYRAFDASLDVGGGMKRSIASLLRAIGARSEQLPHRALAEAIRSGDKEGARRTARAIVVGTKRPG
jgi:GntR family transcriptional regulator, transcriptional repressor for pyruvate dehydrogenase complex